MKESQAQMFVNALVGELPRSRCMEIISGNLGTMPELLNTMFGPGAFDAFLPMIVYNIMSRYFVEPYIGVTGFTARWEVEHVIQSLNASSQKLMVGVLASEKTLNGMMNRHPRRFPLVETIPSLFLPDLRCLNLIHYSTDSPDTLATQLATLTAIGGPNLHGFQLNVPFVPPNEIAQHMKKFPKHRIVLQIGPRMLSDLNPDQLAEHLKSTKYEVTDLLLDASAGRGIGTDWARELAYLRAIRGTNQALVGAGLAGGLDAYGVKGLAPLISEFHGLLSIDAEGRLRDNDDRFDCGKAVDYVKSASEMMDAVVGNGP